MKDDKSDKEFALIILVLILGHIVFWGSLLFIAIHFIRKFW